MPQLQCINGTSLNLLKLTIYDCTNIEKKTVWKVWPPNLHCAQRWWRTDKSLFSLNGVWRNFENNCCELQISEMRAVREIFQSDENWINYGNFELYRKLKNGYCKTLRRFFICLKFVYRSPWMIFQEDVSGTSTGSRFCHCCNLHFHTKHKQMSLPIYQNMLVWMPSSAK